jgi:hypothetical protein
VVVVEMAEEEEEAIITEIEILEIQIIAAAAAVIGILVQSLDR